MTTNYEALTDVQRERLDAWIEALESGKYAQTCDTLRDYKGFCCLGVYADKILDARWEGDELECYTGEGVYHGSMISNRTWDLDGLPITQSDMSDANDKGATFSQIAQVLRAWKDEKTINGAPCRMRIVPAYQQLMQSLELDVGVVEWESDDDE